MKFIHIADLHFDAPFKTLNKKELGEIRRLEQRKIFKKVIEYISENKIQYLFICGDLYEQEYIKHSTIEYINNLFKTIPDTKIFIVPGNHDPYIKNSYYQQYSWNKNVYIFSSNLKKLEEENVNIYGYGFDNFYMNASDTIDKIELEQKDKINILLTHGTLDVNSIEREYNPIYTKQLKKIGFDYIALGHIHKPYCEENNPYIVYPGSLISLGFDEQGKHGMIVGEIEENTKKVNVEFVPMDTKEFVELEIDVTDIISQENLTEKINNIKIQENYYYKIILTGNRNFEIKIEEIKKLIEDKRIIKIKDNTTISINLTKISQENSLKGFFVRNILEKIENNPNDKEKLLKVIEIGLEAMNG